jgi:UDP:flavonoid glycosyltransferase YjiC (YdhE family)
MLKLSLASFGSGLPFPIPRRKIWKNIKIKLRMLYSYLTAREISTLVKHRNSHGIFGRLPHETPLRNVTEVISPDIAGLDFPFKKPYNLRLYGPIVLDSVPVRDLDPQLSDWLDAGPTVLMSMGTHFTYTKAQVRAVLRGFLSALHPKARVLWKLPRHSSFKGIIDELLSTIEEKERFMILDWIPVDPFSIMTHRNVMALVHHGGANSYFEAAL